MVLLYNFDEYMKTYIPLYPRASQPHIKKWKTYEQMFIVNAKDFYVFKNIFTYRWREKKKLLWYYNFNIRWKKNGNKISVLLNFNGYFFVRVWVLIFHLLKLTLLVHLSNLYILYFFLSVKYSFLLTFRRTFSSRYKIKFFLLRQFVDLRWAFGISLKYHLKMKPSFEIVKY